MVATNAVDSTKFALILKRNYVSKEFTEQRSIFRKRTGIQWTKNSSFIREYYPNTVNANKDTAENGQWSTMIHLRNNNKEPQTNRPLMPASKLTGHRCLPSIEQATDACLQSNRPVMPASKRTSEMSALNRTSYRYLPSIKQQINR